MVQSIIRLSLGENGNSPYLTFDEDCTKTVEQLKWSDDVALYKNTSRNGCGRPETGTDWHLVEPLFQRELAKPALKHVGHALRV